MKIILPFDAGIDLSMDFVVIGVDDLKLSKVCGEDGVDIDGLDDGFVVEVFVDGFDVENLEVDGFIVDEFDVAGFNVDCLDVDGVG